MKRGIDLKNEWQNFVEDGSDPAYLELYNHYHDYFSYIGLKKGATAVKVKDCINDLFLYIFEHRQKLSAIQNHHNYLVTAFLRKLFKKEHFTADESADMDEYEAADFAPAADANILSTDTNEKVKNFLKSYIDQLTKTQARLIHEKFYLGLTYEEIAVSNEITVRTAYNTISDALKQLRKHIGEDKVTALTIAISTLSIFIYFFFKNIQ